MTLFLQDILFNSLFNYYLFDVTGYIFLFFKSVESSSFSFPKGNDFAFGSRRETKRRYSLEHPLFVSLLFVLLISFLFFQRLFPYGKKTTFFVPEGVFSSPKGSLFPSGKKSPLGKAKRRKKLHKA